MCCSVEGGYSSRVFQKLKYTHPLSWASFLRQDSPRNKVRTSPAATVSQRCFSIITYILYMSTIFIQFNEFLAEFFNVGETTVVKIGDVEW